MQLFQFLALLALSSLAAARPSSPTALRVNRNTAPGPRNVVYWGQNGGGTIENNDLSYYCQPDSGIDVIVLAFLYQFGNDNNIPSGGIGQSCSITAGKAQNCDNVVSSIAKCKAAGVKMILSLGGATTAYSLQSAAQAQAIGQYLWDAYGNSGNKTVERPFGDNFVDGFDFDIEVNHGSAPYYQYMISTLRANFAKDPANSYYITGAPQCPIPEPNMGEIISTSQFDWLFVQYYNNNNYTVPCALGINGNAPFNYNNWTAFVSTTPSKNAKLFIGVPASPLGANGSPTGATYYAKPDELAGIINAYRKEPNFGGIMMWSAGFSDSNVNDGCTYAQQSKNILVKGVPCNGKIDFPPKTITTATLHSGSPATPTPTAQVPGTIQQFGQVS